MAALGVARCGVDVGGTFTDVVLLAPDRLVVDKIRSLPGDVAPRLWQRLARLRGDATEIALIHGTTVATNALLERTGGRVLLATTAGFEDLLWLRRQDRASLYRLALDHPPPLVAREDVIGVAERIGPRGVIRALTAEEVARVARAARERRPDAVAICLLFSFRDPSHEAALARALRDALPGVPVAASHEILPVFREYERASTTVAEGWLRPRVSGYLQRMGRAAAEHGVEYLRVMASNGGTLSVEQACRRAAALALSGPAGGVEGARLVGRAVGERNLLTVDMGGTSADASVIVNGAPLTESAAAVGGIRLALPHILIETVGAGGGSIAWVDRGGALQVGPHSAGAVPGPACYGLGGEEPTVTDAALILGWLNAAHPLADDLPLDPALARRAVERVARAAGLTLERCAEGIVDVATAAMVRALRRVSVERGTDPRRMTLVPFGGAGPLFACRLAESLGMRRALVPRHPGVLSALGLAAAPERLEFVESFHRPAAGLDAAALDAAYRELEAAARAELPGGDLLRFADCRYPGQGYELTVPVAAAGPAVADAFHQAHRERYGHADPARAVEVVNLRLVARRAAVPPELRADGAEPVRPRGGRVPLDRLAPGTALRGPLMLDGVDATARIEPGWRGTVHASGTLVLERA